MSLKAKIEAVLFMTDKPLRAQAIAGILGEDIQVIRQTLLDLIHDYEERQGGLEIADEDGYSFQVKDQFANLMDEFLPIEMTAAQLRTLSAIAIKQPISQSEIIRIRGAGAYDHIKELVLRGLISKREDEKLRSPMLSTTKQFQEYFRLTKDGKSLRQYLKREMKKKDKEDQLPIPLPGIGLPELNLPSTDLLTLSEPGEPTSMVDANQTDDPPAEKEPVNELDLPVIPPTSITAPDQTSKAEREAETGPAIISVQPTTTGETQAIAVDQALPVLELSFEPKEASTPVPERLLLEKLKSTVDFSPEEDPILGDNTQAAGSSESLN